MLPSDNPLLMTPSPSKLQNDHHQPLVNNKLAVMIVVLCLWISIFVTDVSDAGFEL